MKGIIFTEFLEMVEDKFGLETLDEIITTAEDPIDGAYSSVNNYPHGQLVNMVVALHKKSGIPLEDLLQVYGRHLFNQLASNYPKLMEDIKNSFDLLLNIEKLIHTEVRKLHPDSNPPKFDGEQLDEKTLKLVYRSHRSMGPVAVGLMHGCGDFYGDTFEIETVSAAEDGQTVEFLIKKV